MRGGRGKGREGAGKKGEREEAEASKSKCSFCSELRSGREGGKLKKESHAVGGEGAMV